MQYAGECIGGPFNGRKQVFYRPVMDVAIMDFEQMKLDEMTAAKRADIPPVKWSQYHWSEDDKVWKWQQPLT